MKPRPDPHARAHRMVDELRRRADAITTRLLWSNEPRIDIDIAINELREEMRDLLPGRVWVFDMVYGARWERMRAQGWARSQE